MSGLREMPRPEIKNVIVSKPAITRSTRTGTERMSMVCEREREGERKRTFRAHLLEMSLRPIVLTFAGLIGNSLAYRPPTSGAVGLAGVSTSGRRDARSMPSCHKPDTEPPETLLPRYTTTGPGLLQFSFIRSVHQICASDLFIRPVISSM